MDFLLPVPQPLGVFATLRHWRDIAQSEPVVITPPAFFPISRVEAKAQIKADPSLTDEDAWLDSVIMAASMQVEADLNKTLVRTQFEIVFDQFPIERWIPVPKPPLISVDSFTWFDLLTSTESPVDPASFYLDKNSQPGRVVLYPGKVWPTGVRWQVGARLRFTAGYSGVAVAVNSITFAGGVATVTTSSAHGFTTGQQITVAGADQAAYNGTFAVTVTGAAGFTFPVSGSPTTPATGVITATPLGVPARYLHAVKMLVANWDTNREAGGVMRGTPDIYPAGYESLIGDRIASLG